MTSAGEELFARASAAAPTIVVVGTAKNVGKTVTFSALLRAAARAGVPAGVTSIGRDGEAVDALDGVAKPRLTLPAGTVVALPRALIPRTPALAIVETGPMTSLGPLVFARALRPTACEIGGPPTARGVRATIATLRTLAGGVVLVDGAIDRAAALAGGDDAVIVATGAASGATVEAVAVAAGDLVARLALPARDPGAAREDEIVVDGALSAQVAEALLTLPRGRTVVVADPTRIAIRGRSLARLRAHCDLRCERALRLVACTTSPAGRDGVLDPRALVRAVARATGLPAYDVLAQLAA